MNEQWEKDLEKQINENAVIDPLPNTILSDNHISPESSVIAKNYPFGFRLRCLMRYWVEHKTSQGVRLMSQTNNPKVAGLVWNKPKKSTYSAIIKLFTDEKGHLQHASLSNSAWDEHIDAFVKQCGSYLNSHDWQIITQLKMTNAASSIFYNYGKPLNPAAVELVKSVFLNLDTDAEHVRLVKENMRKDTFVQVAFRKINAPLEEIVKPEYLTVEA